jgi:sterol desaturase/sphingolipid hydroxylase (fatty acid hydroxylase superfamily)
MDAGPEWWEWIPQTLWRIGGRYALFASLAFIVFYLWKKELFRSTKIQSLFPKAKDYQREIAYSALTVLIFGVVAAFILRSQAIRPYTQLMANPDLHGWIYYFLVFPMMLLIHDTYFYWAHRWMHIPFWYRKVHSVHHRSTNPSPWAAYAFHPWEALLEIGILPVFVFGLPVHRTHISLFFLFMIAYNVYGHLGFELYPQGFEKTRIGRWINTSRHHNLHHSRFTGNYGLYFLFWDRWMGTLRTEESRCS